MSDEVSPYQVSEGAMSPVAGSGGPPPLPTSLPRVFGIIHIVYAGLGMLFSMLGIGVFFAAKAMIGALDGESDDAGVALGAFDDMVIYLVLDLVLKLVLGVVLLLAGIGLLKKRLWAQKASIVWAIARMVAAVGMTLLTIGPASELQEKANQLGGEQQEQFQQMLQGAGNVMGILVVCVYPVLTLVFLSRKNVTDSLG